MSNLNIRLVNHYLRKKLNKRFLSKRIFFEKNHNLINTILVQGCGRSGTTWLGEVLAESLKYRLIFEPFRPDKINIFNKFVYKQYLPSDYKNERVYRIFEQIMSGRIKNTWIDNYNNFFIPKGRIVKSIRASLFLKWMRNNFPEIPIIMIIRHPCAVVSSRIKLGWDTAELDLMLKQKMLVNDHLSVFKDIIYSADTKIKQNTCLWCIENLIPLKTMEKKDWIVTFYENLVANFKSEIRKILNYINKFTEIKVKAIKNRISAQANKYSAIFMDKSPLESWKKSLTPEQISEILTITKQFSLDYIYNDNLMPKIAF